MYPEASTSVMPMRANKIWNGCIPRPLLPSTSRRRVVTFIMVPKTWAMSM